LRALGPNAEAEVMRAYHQNPTAGEVRLRHRSDRIGLDAKAEFVAASPLRVGKP
jgi:hypothetical protein